MIQVGRPQRLGAISAEINAVKDREKEYTSVNNNKLYRYVVIISLLTIVSLICLL